MYEDFYVLSKKSYFLQTDLQKIFACPYKLNREKSLMETTYLNINSSIITHPHYLTVIKFTNKRFLSKSVKGFILHVEFSFCPIFRSYDVYENQNLILSQT